MKAAVLFDLGNTLVRYWDQPEFPLILQQSLGQAEAFLAQQGLLRVSSAEAWQRAQKENYGNATDYRVQPLAGRLIRIFDLDSAPYPESLLAELCRRFMQPMFARGQLYDDAVPTLQRLRAQGLRTAIVSNTAWGSSAELWRQETARLGLNDRVDTVVFCDDVGWRKPARQIFEFALARLGVPAEQAVFVGDHPVWDVEGPRNLGMEAVLLQREGMSRHLDTAEQPIHGLDELWSRLSLDTPRGG